VRVVQLGQGCDLAVRDMKVLGVTPLYPPFSLVGAWLSTHECLQRLAERGHEVHVRTVFAPADYTHGDVRVLGRWDRSVAGYDASVYANNHFSTEEAAAVLEKQQWRIGNDGIRARTLGKITQKLDFELTVPNLKFLTDTAQVIKEQWQKIGVRLTIKTLSAEEIQSAAIRPRAYQILLFGNILRANSDLFSFWHSSQRFQPGLNLALYENKTVDKLIDTTRTTFDEQVRSDALSKIQQTINTERPAVFLFSPSYIYAAPTNLGGFGTQTLATPEDRLDNVNQWFLKTSRVFK
jgi:peptide/nickel transport system substrate-binding protein